MRNKTDERDDEVRDAAHHSISVLLGCRNPHRCPRCDSTEWYRYGGYTRCFKDYDDGHCEQLGTDFDGYWTYYCDTCDYEEG